MVYWKRWRVKQYFNSPTLYNKRYKICHKTAGHQNKITVATNFLHPAVPHPPITPDSQSPSNGLATISPYTQIFIDTDTPYTNAPPTVKEILNKAKDNLGSLNPNRIDLGVLAFEPRPTDNHRCMHLFERNIEGCTFIISYCRLSL